MGHTTWVAVVAPASAHKRSGIVDKVESDTLSARQRPLRLTHPRWCSSRLLRGRCTSTPSLVWWFRSGLRRIRRDPNAWWRDPAASAACSPTEALTHRQGRPSRRKSPPAHTGRWHTTLCRRQCWWTDRQWCRTAQLGRQCTRSARWCPSTGRPDTRSVTRRPRYPRSCPCQLPGTQLTLCRLWRCRIGRRRSQCTR